MRLIHGDELPSWQPSITIDGQTVDYSAGHTFTVVISDRSRTAVHTKTTGITGHDDGSLTIAWDADELDHIDPGTYRLRLTIRRIIDDRDLSIDETLIIAA